MCVLCTRACSIFISLSTTTKMPPPTPFFPIWNSCLAQNFQKKTNKQKQNKKTEIYSGLITSWIMAKQRHIIKCVSREMLPHLFMDTTNVRSTTTTTKLDAFSHSVVTNCELMQLYEKWSGMIHFRPVSGEKITRLVRLFDYFYFKKKNVTIRYVIIAVAALPNLFFFYSSHGERDEFK